MPPIDTTLIEKKLTEINDLGLQTREAVDKIMLDFGDAGRIAQAEAAIKQMEEQREKTEKNIGELVSMVKRVSTYQRSAERGSYSGLFASEDEARQFGLAAMWLLGKNKDCAQVLAAEYPEIHKRAMDSTTDSAVIFPEFSNRLIRMVEERGIFERNAFKMPMSSDSLSFLKRTGGMTVYLLGENAAGTQSDPSYANVNLNTKEWGTLTYYPRTLAEDAAAQIGELIAEEIVYAFSDKMDEIGFNGDGTATYFGIVGVRQRLGTVNGVDNGGGLVLGAGNAYSELTAANFLGCVGALPTYAAGNAKWYVSRTVFFTVMVPLILAAGGVTAAEYQGRRQLMFQGDPVEISQVMPRAEANSQICALYGDLRQAATVGRRREMKVEESKEYKFAERQVTVLGTQRVAVNVHDVGDATNAGPIIGLITGAS